MNFIAKIIAVFTIIFSMTINTFCSENINVSNWSKSNVTKAQEVGLISNKDFSDYTKNMTRREISQLAVNFYKQVNKTLPEVGESNFTDYKDKNAAIVLELGIMAGTSSNKFSPDSLVTREQMATILSNTIKACGKTDLMPSKNYFSDHKQISSWALDGVYMLKDLGIINGYNGNFKPKDNVTREQAIFSFVEALDKIYFNSNSIQNEGPKGEDTNTQTSKKYSYININGKKIEIGEPLSSVESKLGKPFRIDKSVYGYDRYVYDSTYTNFIMLGIEDKKVVEIFSNSNNIECGGLNTNSDHSNIIPLEGANLNKSYIEFAEGNNKINFILDSYNGFKIDSIYIVDQSIERKKNGTNVEIQNANEKELLDIINSLRIKYGIEPFSTNSAAIDIARNHSDLLNLRSYIFYNANGSTPFDRMKNGGISFSYAAENIAKTTKDVIDVYTTWINNAGYRTNILDKELTHTGIGCKIGNEIVYITMDMYRP